MVNMTPDARREKEASPFSDIFGLKYLLG